MNFSGISDAGALNQNRGPYEAMALQELLPRLDPSGNFQARYARIASLRATATRALLAPERSLSPRYGTAPTVRSITLWAMRTWTGAWDGYENQAILDISWFMAYVPPSYLFP